jgi:hypothetical protein
MRGVHFGFGQVRLSYADPLGNQEAFRHISSWLPRAVTATRNFERVVFKAASQARQGMYLGDVSFSDSVFVSARATTITVACAVFGTQYLDLCAQPRGTQHASFSCSEQGC